MTKFKGLVTLITSVQPNYHQLVSDNELKAVQEIEISIGAGIWYLPTRKERLFTGLISKEALKVVPIKRSQEHIYPRKLSAYRLLNIDWSQIKDPEQYLEDLYWNELGRYKLVTKKENKLLQKHQSRDRFTTWQEAYEKEGIEMVTMIS